MLNPSRVLSSPNFAQTFNVYRSMGHFDLGGWVEEPQSPPCFSVSGVIYPSTAKEIRQVPEGDRVEGMMTFVSVTQLYATRASEIPGTSDQLEWRDEKYRVIQVMPFMDYGFNVAVAARMSGD
jgi:hypothetical protein